MLALLACAVPQANAGVITLFDNSGDQGGAAITILSTVPIGDSFSTGSTAVTLTDVTVFLKLEGAATGSSTFVLDSDNGGPDPGSLIATLGAIDDTSLTNSVAPYSFTPLDISLAANTRYWILATSTGNAAWSSAAIGDGTGLDGEYFVQGTLTPLADDDGPFNMIVDAQGTATPEPGTFSLIGFGLAAFAWTRRRKL